MIPDGEEVTLTMKLCVGDEEYIIAEGAFLGNDHFQFIDNFGRKWKLIPVTNERIMMPFIITPLLKET